MAKERHIRPEKPIRTRGVPRVDRRPASDIIQARWVTEPGNWKGLSPITAARRAAYIGEASDDAIARHFQQGVRSIDDFDQEELDQIKRELGL